MWRQVWESLVGGDCSVIKSLVCLKAKQNEIQKSRKQCACLWLWLVKFSFGPPRALYTNLEGTWEIWGHVSRNLNQFDFFGLVVRTKFGPQIGNFTRRFPGLVAGTSPLVCADLKACKIVYHVFDSNQATNKFSMILHDLPTILCDFFTCLWWRLVILFEQINSELPPTY